jgi:hypothetical protein
VNSTRSYHPALQLELLTHLGARAEVIMASCDDSAGKTENIVEETLTSFLLETRLWVRFALSSACIEYMVAGFDLPAALHQLQRPQPVQSIVETAAVRFVAGCRGHLFLGQCIGKHLGEGFQNEPFGFSQPPAPIVNQGGNSRQRLP